MFVFKHSHNGVTAIALSKKFDADTIASLHPIFTFTTPRNKVAIPAFVTGDYELLDDLVSGLFIVCEVDAGPDLYVPFSNGREYSPSDAIKHHEYGFHVSEAQVIAAFGSHAVEALAEYHERRPFGIAA